MVYVPNDGLEYNARYIGQQTAGYFSWIALDDGTTVEAAGTTALTSEITTDGGERKVAVPTYEASYKAVWTTTFTFTGASFTIEGVGLFNQLAVGGKVFMVHKLAAIKNVDSGETMEVIMKSAYGRP